MINDEATNITCYKEWIKKENPEFSRVDYGNYEIDELYDKTIRFYYTTNNVIINNQTMKITITKDLNLETKQIEITTEYTLFKPFYHCFKFKEVI